MDTERPLRVGIVGCGAAALGRWGHIPALKKIRAANLAAVCNLNENLAKKVAESYHIDSYYADLSEMLKNGKLDIVDICTSPKTHAPLSFTAMQAGCHVLVEKPIALSPKEADEMIRASKESKVKLCVVHNNLFYPTVMKARSMVSHGVIGDLTGISITYSWPKDRAEFTNKDHWYHKLPGGVFGEMLPHTIYLAVAFLGNLEPVAVYAKRLSNYEWVTADELGVILEGEKGIGTITASCNWPKDGKDYALFDVFGTKRNLHIDLYNAVLTEYGVSGGSRSARVLDNLSQSYQQWACIASATFNTVLGRHHTGHRTLIEKFIESVLNDTAPPVTGEEGREVVRVLEKIAAQISTRLSR